jgi:predicted transcriptional regulator
MNLENIFEKIKEIENRINNLECKIEILEKILGKSNININVEIPKVIIEKKALDIRISEDELLGRMILLVKEGFFDIDRTASEVAKELIRRCWHPKDMQHIRPTLEQLTFLGILERRKERKQKGKGLKWVYKRKENLEILENKT